MSSIAAKIERLKVRRQIARRERRSTADIDARMRDLRTRQLRKEIKDERKQRKAS